MRLPFAGNAQLMAEDDTDTGKLPGVPEPDPPEGGPNADPDTPDPADVTPGLGGTSKTRPLSTEEDEPPD